MPRTSLKKSVGEPGTSIKMENLQYKIIENLVALQKVHTSLAEKFDNLANQMSTLLNLFETTAKTFANNPENMVSEKDKDFLEKIDRLLEQNKTIAKGLTMMEERIREKVYGTQPQPLPLPQKPVSQEKEGYEVSRLERPLPKF